MKQQLQNHALREKLIIKKLAVTIFHWITVHNPSNWQSFRFYQSWRSGISEYLTEYDKTVATITKSFVSSRAEEMEKATQP